MARPRHGRSAPPGEIVLPPLAPFADGSLVDGGDYEAVAFDDLSLAGQRAAGASFVACRLARCEVSGLLLQRARIADSRLAELRGVTLDAADSLWRDSLVTDPRLGALVAPGATWRDIRVRGGKVDFVQLGGSTLTNVAFEACVIDELALADAAATDLTFIGCRIGALDVAGARLAGVDLSGAQVGTLRGIEHLRGATISEEQLHDLAPQLAAWLGLTVRN